MKLSKAIRAGAKLRPQGFNAFFVNFDNKGLCSCALGAAIEAVTFCEDHTDDSCLEVIDKNWPKIIPNERTLCPAFEWCLKGKGKPNKIQMISHLNDDHNWTREKIADWAEAQGL